MQVDLGTIDANLTTTVHHHDSLKVRSVGIESLPHPIGTVDHSDEIKVRPQVIGPMPISIGTGSEPKPNN